MFTLVRRELINRSDYSVENCYVGASGLAQYAFRVIRLTFFQLRGYSLRKMSIWTITFFIYVLVIMKVVQVTKLKTFYQLF